MLGHLPAVLGQDVAQAQHVPVGRLVEDQGADRHQRVEPAAGLVDGLADEVGGVGLLEPLRGSGHVGVAPLREGHGPGVEPGVDHLGHSACLRAAVGAVEGDLVDEGPVRVQLGLVAAGEVGELARATRRTSGGPRRSARSAGGAPVAAARERPVDVVVQPVAVPAPLDRVGVPVGPLVLTQQGVLDRGGPDVPGRLGVVHERGVAAPAVRVGVLVGHVAEEQPAGVEVLDQVGVGVLEELPADQGDRALEVPVGAHRGDHGQPVGLADLHVVLAEGGGLVHQAGAVLGGDVVAENDVVRLGREVDELERALVAPALEVGPAQGRLDGPALAEDLLEQRLGDDQGLLPVGGDHVVDAGVHRDGGVRHQRPGRRRPHQQARLAGVLARGQREPHVDRRVGHRLVALRQLVVGEPGPAARAVRRDPVVLDQQALVVDLLQRPPDGLDVRGVHRPVGVVGVDPVAHPLGHLLEGADVAEHRLAAPGVELGDPVGLDVALAGEPELLLDGELDGQPVAVPAGLPLDAVALHGLEAGEDVLEDPSLDVVGARQAVRRRGTLVEGPGGAPSCGVERLVEDLVVAPEVEHVVLERRQVHLRRDRVVLTHRLRPSHHLHWRRDDPGRLGRYRGTTLLGHSGTVPSGYDPLFSHRCRFYPSRGGRSSGGSGVIFTVCRHPRAPTVPGSLWAVQGLLVPSTPCDVSSLPDPTGATHTGFPSAFV